jgi:hypothetical protein
MDADTRERPEDESWSYLETLERQAQSRKIRRRPIPVEVQPGGSPRSDEDDLL